MIKTILISTLLSFAFAITYCSFIYGLKTMFGVLQMMFSIAFDTIIPIIIWVLFLGFFKLDIYLYNPDDPENHYHIINLPGWLKGNSWKSIV